MRLLTFTLCLTTALQAQWLHQPTRGIPRLPDGKANLAAPAPRTSDDRPDLSGQWGLRVGSVGQNFVRGWKPNEIQPRAVAQHQKRLDDLGKDAPTVLCLPMGPLSNLSPVPDAGFKIVQTPELIVFLYTTLEFRQVFLDGRALEADPNPSWMGYSVGHWEGETLVVESNGFIDRSWLDMEGHPHTEHLRMTERFRRTDFGHLEFTTTFEDPDLYARPIQVSATAQAMVDTSLMEFVCNENEKDRDHMIGLESDDPTMNLSWEALSKYEGTYRMVGLGPVPLP